MTFEEIMEAERGKAWDDAGFDELDGYTHTDGSHWPSLAAYEQALDKAKKETE